MTVLEELLALQSIDTEIAQLEHRISHLPEADALRTAEQDATRIGADLRRVQDELARLGTLVETNEAAVADLRRQAERLNGQLRTVIAPREAEALQHEIKLLSERAAGIDDESLGAIEHSEELDGESRRLEANLSEANEVLAAAREAVAVATAVVAANLEDARGRRGAVAATLDPAIAGTYDAKRRDLAGVAVARLVRATCGGCHLDLSPTEVEFVKKQPADDRECPNCTRWLVV